MIPASFRWLPMNAQGGRNDPARNRRWGAPRDSLDVATRRRGPKAPPHDDCLTLTVQRIPTDWASFCDRS